MSDLPIPDQPIDPLATVEDIYHCYRLLLNRPPDEHGWRALTGMVGTLTHEDLLLIFLTHPEFKQRAIYGKMLGDDPALPVLAPCDGFALYVSPNDEGVGQGILATGSHEPHVTTALRRVLKRGMTVVDVGANIGYLSHVAARAVGPQGRVIAIEPSQRNAQLLHLSAAHNGLSNIQLFPLAASDAPTMLVYHALAGSNGLATDLDTGGDGVEGLAHRTLVAAVRLDDLLGNLTRLDVLKMDIEGAEYRALRGAERLIARHRPMIFTEFSPGWLPQLSGVSAEGYLRALLDLDYAIAIIEQDGSLSEAYRSPGPIMARFEGVPLDHLDLLATPTEPRRMRGLIRRMARR